MRLRILSAFGLVGLTLAVSGCGVNEQKVGTAAATDFVSCFHKTNPTTVAAVDQNFTLYTSGKPVTGCSTGKKLSSKEVTAATAAAAPYRARVSAIEQAAKRKLAVEQQCKTAIQPLFTALDLLQGQVTGGVNSDEYSTDYGVAEGVSIQQQTALSATATACQTIAGHLQKAISAYDDASSTWIACTQDDYEDSCVGDSATGLTLQELWSKAATDVSQGQAELNDLMRGIAPTTATSRAESGSELS